MNKEIKELAFDAGFSLTPCGVWEAEDANIERFAELVRQDEREACAKLCQSKLQQTPYRDLVTEAIRGRTE